MRILILSILVLLTAAGFAWNQYQAEIRDLLGLPPIAESEKRSEKKKTGTKVDRDDRNPPRKVDRGSQGEAERESEIRRIVELRFDNVDSRKFSDKFQDLAEVPETSYPARVKVSRPMEFNQTIDGNIVAVSYLQEGGMARPFQIENGGILRLQSLANPSMEATLPIDETDFREQVQSAHDLAYSRAEARLREMREAEASDLRAFRGLLDDWAGRDLLWEFPAESRFQSVREAIERRIDPEKHRIAGFWEKIVRMDGETRLVTTALVEGTDLGFGPLQWRVQVQKKGDEIVSISGLPEE